MHWKSLNPVKRDDQWWWINACKEKNEKCEESNRSSDCDPEREFYRLLWNIEGKLGWV